MNTSRPVVYVIPCGAAKGPEPTRARDLYTSDHFRYVLATALHLAEEDGGRVMILSAKHGLLDLDDVVAPYNTKIADMDSFDTPSLLDSMDKHGLLDADPEWYAFLPADYYQRFTFALATVDQYAADVYEAARGIGYQRGAVARTRLNPGH